jgi:hypothetical protein
VNILSIVKEWRNKTLSLNASGCQQLPIPENMLEMSFLKRNSFGVVYAQFYLSHL